jgi:hypothetical protein
MTDPSMQSDGTIPFRTDNKHPRWRRRAKDAGGLLRRYGRRCIEVHETVNPKEDAHE